jgi:hypothetical protein
VFDFRYHTLSLVAVLVALVLGLLLGVAIGDRNLVSSAEHGLRKSLRADVRAAQKHASDLQAQLDTRKRFESAAYPLLVGGELEGRRIALLFLGDASNHVRNLVHAALAGSASGGRLTSVAAIREPLDLGGLGNRASGTRYASLTTSPDLIGPFGTRMGIQLAAGGKLVAKVRPALLSSFSGSLGPFDAVVVMRNRADGLTDSEATAADAFERGLIGGLEASNVPVVGVETTDTSPSQVSWYRDRHLSSVDDVDDPIGRAALVFALAGVADGAFGIQPGEPLLPDVGPVRSSAGR